MSVADRVALVLGAAGGIGTAVVARLAAEGAQVWAADLDNPDVAAPETPDTVRAVSVDVTREDSVRQLIDAIDATSGRLDILVNAAGVEVEKTIEETSLAEWDHCFAVNVTGTFLVSKHALPLLRAGARGGVSASVINVGSYDGFIADPGLAAYCATKGAVHALTRAMACDHGPEGIRVNAVCPGYIDTPMLRSFFAGAGSGGGGQSIGELEQAVRDVHPIGRYGTPQDVANLVHWLASDEARYATGQLWVLDGGLTCQVQQMRP